MSNFTYSFKDMDALAKYIESKGQGMLDSVTEDERRDKRRMSKVVAERNRTTGNTYLSIADMLKHTVLEDNPTWHRRQMELGDLYSGVLF